MDGREPTPSVSRCAHAVDNGLGVDAEEGSDEPYGEAVESGPDLVVGLSSRTPLSQASAFVGLLLVLLRYVAWRPETAAERRGLRVFVRSGLVQDVSHGTLRVVFWCDGRLGKGCLGSAQGDGRRQRGQLAVALRCARGRKEGASWRLLAGGVSSASS